MSQSDRNDTLTYWQLVIVGRALARTARRSFWRGYIVGCLATTAATILAHVVLG